MQIDLSNPDSLTIDSVRELLAQGDDSSPTQLRVSKSGLAYLSKVVGPEDIDDLAFRLETFAAQNGYVGPGAAADSQWVARVHRCIQENWPHPSATYIDFY